MSVQPETGATRNPVDRVSVFVAAGVLSGFGALMYEVASQFTYLLGHSYGFGEANQGDFTGAFFTGFSLIAVSMVFWVRRVNWRRLCVVASLVGTAAFAALLIAKSYHAIVLMMFIAGLGMGANYALTLTLFGDSSKPDRAFGFKFFCDVMPGVTMNFFLPAIFDAGGFHAVALSMAGCCVISAFAGLWLPATTGRPRPAVRNPFRAPNAALPLLGCLVCLINTTGIMALWGFLGQLGDLKGLSGSTLGTILAVGSMLNGAGALIGSWMGDRYGRLRPIAVTLAVSVASLLIIAFTSSAPAYIVGALMFCLVNNLTSLYILSTTAAVDRTGQFLPFASACFSGGAVFGPPLAGRLLEAQGLSAMLTFPAVMWATGFLLLLLLHRLDRGADESALRRGSNPKPSWTLT